MTYQVLYSDFNEGEKISSDGLSNGKYLFVKDEDSFSPEPMHFKVLETEDTTKTRFIQATGDFPITIEDYILVVDSKDTNMEINVSQLTFNKNHVKNLNELTGGNLIMSQLPAFRARRYGRMTDKYSFLGKTYFSWKELKQTNRSKMISTLRLI